MATFGLIPGACRGAWCFEQLIPALEEPVAQPDVATTSIVCTDDRVVRAEWSGWAAGERLGAAR